MRKRPLIVVLLAHAWKIFKVGGESKLLMLAYLIMIMKISLSNDFG